MLEHFQFETLRASNHTACRFAKERGFSARLFQRKDTLILQLLQTNRTGSTCMPIEASLPLAPDPPEKARWGKDGGLGGKNFLNAFPSERLGPLALAATEGGRRPCPLRRRKLRASTAEMRGFPSPQQLANNVRPCSPNAPQPCPPPCLPTAPLFASPFLCIPTS